MSNFPEYQFHELANIFPMLEGAEYEAFRADIKENKLRDPLWSYEGKIIDGRNRYRVCRELGIIPPVREWDGKGSLVTFVVSLNLHRRHLTASQRAALAAEIQPLLAKEAARRRAATLKQGNGPVPAILPTRGTATPAAPTPAPTSPQPSPGEPGESRAQAAKMTGASPRNVSNAAAVKKTAPKVFDQVKAGTLTLAAAQREVQASKETPKAPDVPPVHPTIAEASSRILKAAKAVADAIGPVDAAGGAAAVVKIWTPGERETRVRRIEQAAQELTKWAAGMQPQPSEPEVSK